MGVDVEAEDRRPGVDVELEFNQESIQMWGSRIRIVPTLDLHTVSSHDGLKT